MPTHLTTPGYGPCGFVQTQRFATDTTHLGSVPRRRPFQGLIDGSPRRANSSGGKRWPHPDDDYPPAKFGLIVIIKTHRLGCSETGRFDQLVKILGIVQRQKEIPKIESLGIVAKAESDPQRYYGRVWSNLTVKEY